MSKVASNGVLFSRGSEEQKQLKNQIMAFVHLNGFSGLRPACESTGYDYQIISTQLNGYRTCRVLDIEKFIKSIDPKKGIEIHNGKPVITYKNG